MITVLGSGVAGLSCALEIARRGGTCRLVTPGLLQPDSTSPDAHRLAALAAGNTGLAQGGIAGALGQGDTPEAHARDTVEAGAGLSVLAAADLLARDGVARLRDLLATGFPADRDSVGALELGLEGAHSAHRIVHAGEDRTGAALSQHLIGQVLDRMRLGLIEIVELGRATDLLIDRGRVRGVCIEGPSGRAEHDCAQLIVATGGYAGIFERTSSSSSAAGEGILLAARAGALLADLEFVQQHPTVLAGTSQLISEAVRGAGAVLRDARGDRFMLTVHPRAELAPRDVVSREITRILRRDAVSEVWLDATPIERGGGPGTLATRFPQLTRATLEHGYEWTAEPVPVAPAAHYTMGGIATDVNGRTTIPGLFAAGEAASTGVHGANRLASNSLLEGLVFGARAARAALADAVAGPAAPSEQMLDPGLARMSETSVRIASDGRDLRELVDAAAILRTESRGAHWRDDFPNPDPAQARRRGLRLEATSTCSRLIQRSSLAC